MESIFFSIHWKFCCSDLPWWRHTSRKFYLKKICKSIPMVGNAYETQNLRLASRECKYKLPYWISSNFIKKCGLDKKKQRNCTTAPPSLTHCPFFAKIHCTLEYNYIFRLDLPPAGACPGFTWLKNPLLFKLQSLITFKLSISRKLR